MGAAASIPAVAAPAEVPAAAAADDGFALLRDRVQAMASYTPIALGAHLLGAAIVEWLFARTAPAALRAGWGAAFVMLWIVRSLLGWRYAARPPCSEAALRRWLRGWLAGVLASAALWGAAAWLFYGQGDGLQRTALLLLVYSYCVASVPVLAPQFAVYVAVIALQFVPAMVRVALDGRPYAQELAAVMLVIWIVTAALGRHYRQSADALARLRLSADRLTAQLRAEKAAADAARLQAEIASRAKTQFFAAASHDLRQPLHALGLYAEALRRHGGRDRQAIELVDSIDASVAALDGLFSELLDISRIDSGAVEVRPRDFALGELFGRLRLDFEPVAFDKGLELRFRGARHRAHADALLVERILRNLVANALRYTADGGVLVGARRRGDRLLLQVCDTGVGIAAADRERVFEEFYQAAGGAPPAGRRKGLGLGLAIVRRLAALMDAPIALASTPGRGTVFTLDLPAARATPTADGAAADAPPPNAGPPLTLAGRRIVLVAAEPAARGELEALLTGWGAGVTSFDGVDAAVAWAVRHHAGAAPAPELLIVDARPGDGAGGADAVGALRQGFAGRIPAIVIADGPPAAHGADAGRDDIHRLAGPVMPNRLRALIGF